MSIKLNSVAAATLTAGGTAQKIKTAPAAAKVVYVSCPSSNAANIWIGDANVKASTKRGLELAKGATIALYAPEGGLLDAGAIYFDGTTNDLASMAYIADANG
jgi:hypothetical protein